MAETTPTATPKGDLTLTGLVYNADQRGVSRPQGAACDIGAYEEAMAPRVRLPLVLQ